MTKDKYHYMTKDKYLEVVLGFMPADVVKANYKHLSLLTGIIGELGFDVGDAVEYLWCWEVFDECRKPKLDRDTLDRKKSALMAKWRKIRRQEEEEDKRNKSLADS